MIELLAQYGNLINIVLIPILMWIIKIERRMVKIETTLEIKFHKNKEA